jgi:hypothetical protein
MDVFNAFKKKWRRVKKQDHVPEWDNWENFYEWCHDTHYTPGDKLLRIYPTEPYGPDNCFWMERPAWPDDEPETLPWPEPDAETTTDPGIERIDREFVRRWNRTVNVFRRALGLSLFPED